MLLLLFGTGVPGAIVASASLSIAASASLTAPVPLRAQSEIRISVDANLRPPGFVATSGITIGTAASKLTAPVPLRAVAGFSFTATGSFARPMSATAGFTFGTAATISRSPRESAAAITIDGVDVIGRVRMSGLTIRDVLNDAPNTCSLVIEGDGPAVGQRLRVTVNEGSRVLFAGTIQTVDQSFESLPKNVAWQVTAIDDTARANARRPFGNYVDVSASDIAIELTEQFAPDFSTAGIAADLPTVSIVFDGSDTMIAALARLATVIGGYCKIEDQIVYLFQVDPGAVPDPIDETHRFLMVPAVQANIDASQLRTRVYGKGYGEAITADIAPGETLIPLKDGRTFSRYGGDAIAATTPDGAQSEHVTFTSREVAGGGTLVGPGAAPTAAPVVALAGGSGVDTGPHTVSVVFVTASGKTLASPAATIDVGVHPPPPTAPVAGAALAGTGPDLGTHDYVVSFLTAYGETVPGPPSNYSVANGAVGVLPAPGPPDMNPSGPHTGAVEFGYHWYAVTYVNAQGETEMGTRRGTTTAPIMGGGAVAPIVGPSSGGTGGNLTPGKRYFYTATYFNAQGESAGGNLTSGGDVTLTAAQNAVNLGGVPQPFGSGSEFVTGRRIYRHEDNNGSWPTGPWFLVGTINNVGATTYLDTMAQSQAATGPSRTWNDLMTVSTMGPHTIPVANISTGPAGTTSRRLYRSRVNGGSPPPDADYFLVATISNNTQTGYDDAKSDAALGAAGPLSNTTGTAVQRIPLSNIPIGPPGVTARKLYRRINGWDGNPFKLVDTIANNTATTYTDSKPGAALGPPPLSVPTAVGNQIAATVPISGSGAVTSRELYMSPIANATRRRIATLADNTTTAYQITQSDAVIAGGIVEPISDTSGLSQPQGQVNPGATVIPVASAATFRTGGGWVSLAGDQVVRYTGLAGQTLTGIPAAGPGSITTTVLYGSQAIPSGILIGVSGLTVPIAKGSAIHIWIQRDDLIAQAEQAARDGSDGVVEYLLVDTRRAVESLTARCDADLAMFSRPIVTVSYATRDLKTQSGKQITIDLASPRISEVLTIQEVTITEIDLVVGLAPRFTVKASSVRFSLEDTLRRLIAGGPIVAGG